MELLFRLIGLCISAVILKLVISKYHPEMGICLSLLAAVIAYGAILSTFGELMDFYHRLIEQADIDEELFIPVWKAMGIALVVRLGEGVCRDAGDSTLATVIESAGSACALIVSLPLLKAVLSVFLELLL